MQDVIHHTTDLKWLKEIKKIEPRENQERLMYKTILLYTIWIAEINVPNIKDCIFVLNKARERINNKIKILSEKLPKNERL